MEAQQTVLQGLQGIFSKIKKIEIPSAGDISQIKELLDEARVISQSLGDEKGLDDFQGVLDFFMSKAVAQIEAAKIPQLLRLANDIAVKYSLNINSKFLDERIAEFSPQEIQDFSYSNSAKDLFVAMSQMGFGAKHLQAGAKTMSEIFSKFLSRRVFSERGIEDLVTIGTHFKHLGMLDTRKAHDFLIKVNNYYKPKKSDESSNPQELQISNISEISSSSLFEIVAYYYFALDGEKLDLELEKRFFSGKQKDQSEASQEQLGLQREFFDAIVRDCKKMRLGAATEEKDKNGNLKKVVVGDFEFEFEGEYAKIDKFCKFGDVVVRDLRTKKVIAVCELDGTKDHFVSIDGEFVERGKYLARDRIIGGGGSLLIGMTGTEFNDLMVFAKKISPLLQKMSEIIAERARLKKAAEDAEQERKFQEAMEQRKAVDAAYKNAMLEISAMAQEQVKKVDEVADSFFSANGRRGDLLLQLEEFQRAVMQKFAALTSNLKATNVAAEKVKEKVEVVPVAAAEEGHLDKLDSEMSVPEESLQEAFARIVFDVRKSNSERYEAIEDCLKSAEKEKSIDALNSVTKGNVGAMQFAIEAKDEILVNLLNFYGITKLPDGYRVDEDHELYDLLVKLFKWEVVDRKKTEIPDDIVDSAKNLEDPLPFDGPLAKARLIKNSPKSDLNDCAVALLNQILFETDEKGADFLVRNQDLLSVGDDFKEYGEKQSSVLHAARILFKADEEGMVGIVNFILTLYPDLPNAECENVSDEDHGPRQIRIVELCIDGGKNSMLKAFAQNNFAFSDQEFIDIVRKYTVGVHPDFELVNLVVKQDLSRLKRCINKGGGDFTIYSGGNAVTYKVADVIIDAIRQVFNKAIKDKDKDLVQAILDTDCGVNLLKHKDGGNTPIFTAIAADNVEALEACLEKADDEDFVADNDKGMSPLYFAVLLGKDKMVESLTRIRAMRFSLKTKGESADAAKEYLLTSFVDKKCGIDQLSPRELAKKRSEAARKSSPSDVAKYVKIDISMNACVSNAGNNDRRLVFDTVASNASSSGIYQAILSALDGQDFKVQEIVSALEVEDDQSKKYTTLQNLDVLQFLVQRATTKHSRYREMQCLRVLAQCKAIKPIYYGDDVNTHLDYALINGAEDVASLLAKNGANISRKSVIEGVRRACDASSNDYELDIMDFLCENQPLELAQILVIMNEDEDDPELQSIKQFCPISSYTNALNLALKSNKTNVIQELVKKWQLFTNKSFAESGIEDENRYLLKQLGELQEELSDGDSSALKSSQGLIEAIDMILESLDPKTRESIKGCAASVDRRIAKKHSEMYREFAQRAIAAKKTANLQELQIIVSMDDVETIKQLESKGDIHHILELAVDCQSPNIFAHFLSILIEGKNDKSEEEANAIDNTLKSLLLRASRKQNQAIVRNIFSAGESWEQKDVVEACAVGIASHATDVVEFLWQKVEGELDLYELCRNAIEVDRFDIAIKIAKKMRNMAKDGNGWLDVVKSERSFLLTSAIQREATDFLKFIIYDLDLAECGFKSDDDKQQTILVFATSITYEMVETLLSHQKNYLIEKSGKDKGKDKGEAEYKNFLDKKDEHDGYSPMVAAIANSDPEAAYLLLIEGASVDSKESSLQPLDAALEKGYSDLVRNLIARGAKSGEVKNGVGATVGNPTGRPAQGSQAAQTIFKS